MRKLQCQKHDKRAQRRNSSNTRRHSHLRHDNFSYEAVVLAHENRCGTKEKRYGVHRVCIAYPIFERSDPSQPHRDRQHQSPDASMYWIVGLEGQVKGVSQV